MIDAHVHLTPPFIAADRELFLAGEGPWTALYRDPKARMASTGELLAVMDAEGVEKALVCGFPWSREDNARRHNEWLLAEAAKYPGRLVPLAAFDLLAPWALKHAEQMLAAGMAGLGELALYDRGFGPRELEAIAALGELCKASGKILQVHVNEPIGHRYPGKAPMEIGQIMALVQRCQGVRLILAHFGGGLPLLAALKKEVSEYLALVRFDTAAMPYLYQPAALPMALRVLPAQHFVLGTDFPLLKPGRYLKFFREAGLGESAIAQICGPNIAAFLNA